MTEISIFGYFFYVSVYNLTLSIFGLRKQKTIFSNSGDSNKILVLLPAYKEDEVIVQTVKQLLKANYPTSDLQIVVIADSLQEKTIKILHSFPIEVKQVSFDKSTKVKAINSYLDQQNIEADIMVILDADNDVEAEFFNKVNSLFNQGQLAIQGRRLLKNPVNNMTFLDDLSEQINNHINRKGSCTIGGSSSIAGSGFAVKFDMGQKIFSTLKSVGGFDKEFELQLLNNGIKTFYVEDLEIYDEKVSNTHVFKNQRRRWISSQYVFLRKYFKAGIISVFKGDFSFFNSSVLRNFQLPRLINLGFFSIVILLVFLFAGHIVTHIILWCIMFVLFIGSILIAIPKRYYNAQLLKSILKVPGVFFQMLLIIFKLKGANESFIHTPHGSIISKDDN